MPLAVKTFPRLAEAAAALGADRAARYHGGGTLVMRALNEGDVSIATLVRSTDPALTQLHATGARVVLGAGVTLARILAERELAFLHKVARLIGGPALRAAATVAGNLFAPSPYGDLGAALLALDATVTLQGGHGGGREVPLAQFFAERGRGSGGLVGAISFTRPSGDAFRFRKVSRVHPKGASVLAIAAHLPGGGRVSGARIAYNAMAPMPIRVPAVERALEGRALDSAGIAEALRVAAEGTDPPTDALASAWYRREVIGVHLRRLLLNEPE